jgi:hypothetical protein
MMILFDLSLRDCKPVVVRKVNRMERDGWTGPRELQPFVLFVDKMEDWFGFFLCLKREKRRRVRKQATVNE